MKLAISDFDNTLYFSNRVEPIAAADSAAIAAWQQENKFVIATGRDYRFLRELLPERLQPDAFICLTGAIVYNEQGKLLYQQPIDNICLRHLLEMDCLAASAHVACFTPYSLFVDIHSAVSWFRQTKMADRYTAVDGFFSSCLKGVCQINLQYATHEAAVDSAASINAALPELSACATGLAVDIVNAEVDKAQAAKNLYRIQKWPITGIVAFGDGTNDLPLFQNFHGAAIASAPAAIQAQARCSYLDLATWLQAMQK